MNSHLLWNMLLFWSVVVWITGCAEPNQYQPPPPPSVTVAKPIRQTVTNYLDETGSTEPVEMVAIRARVRGYLEEINFEAGTPVAKGQTLYLIQQGEYQAKVNSAKADVRANEVAVNLAKIEFERQQNLVADNATARSRVEQAEAARDAAMATLEASNAALERAELDLGYTTVTTPISGRVGKTLVKFGNLVGDAEATHLTTVVSYDPIYVNFSISERDLLRASRRSDEESSDKLDITQIKAFVRRALDKGFPFEGHLEYADLAVDQSTGTFMIRAVFPNPREEIIPGLFVRVRIPIGTTENAVLVPERAIAADQAGRFVLIVVDDNIVERRNIEMGAKYEEMVVIADGLTGDELVVIDGIQRSRPGAEVSPKEIQLSKVEGGIAVIEEGSQSPIEDASAIPTPDASGAPTELPQEGGATDSE